MRVSPLEYVLCTSLMGTNQPDHPVGMLMANFGRAARKGLFDVVTDTC
jgi:hypothetical protein